MRFAWRRLAALHRSARADVHPFDAAAFPVRLIAGLSAAAFVWLVAGEIGYRIVRPFVTSRCVAVGLGAALGYALLGSAIALLGVAHAIRPWAAIGLVIVAAVVRVPAYLGILQRRHALFASLQDWYRSLATQDRLALFVCAFATLTALIAAALPAVWWDPIAYHLPIAAAALVSGGFAFDPGMVQSGFPALGEAAALPAYAFAGSAGAAMSTLFAGIVFALLCGLLADRLAAGTGPLAAALVASSALWLWLAPSFYVDIPFALFAVAAIAVPTLARDRIGQGTPASGIVGLGALCGTFAGAAAAIKYPGLVVGVLACAMVLAAGPPRRAALLGSFAVGFAVIAAGWYVRNLVVAGDPLYPFLADLLHRPQPLVAFSDRYVTMTRHWCGGGTSFVDLVVMPYRLLVDPRSFCGDPGYALRLGVIFAVACVIMVRRSWPLALACIALTLFWFESSQQWRFLAPAMALFAVLAAAGTAALSQRMRALGGGVLLTLCALGVLVNWLPATIAEASDSLAPGYAYIVGREDGVSYLQRRLETFGAMRWLSAHAVDKTSVISLDDVRTYYAWGGVAWANPYYQQRWDLDWAAPAASRYAALRANGFRYLLVNASEPYVKRTPTGVDWTVLSSDIAHGVLKKRFVDGDVAIYEMSAPP